MNDERASLLLASPPPFLFATCYDYYLALQLLLIYGTTIRLVRVRTASVNAAIFRESHVSQVRLIFLFHLNKSRSLAASRESDLRDAILDSRGREATRKKSSSR